MVKMSEQQDLSPDSSFSSKAFTINPMDIVKYLLYNWYWFVLSIFICSLFAGAYLWFTPVKVDVTGKMEIIEKSNSSSGLSAGMAMLNSLPMGLGSALGGGIGGSLAIDSEKEIMMSKCIIKQYHLMKEVMKED